MFQRTLWRGRLQKYTVLLHILLQATPSVTQILVQLRRCFYYLNHLRSQACIKMPN
ncbi:hypothetical protein Tsubulata_021965 [Turnera subulata]|uniref:Uncharacterized protein n=1 Tax=Turnera subulata TaxID=218843 RepID=A0A9Q0FNA3_9ROSI|nr:hypothetical protein Tsubulata_021965 [Turnera subulata]